MPYIGSSPNFGAVESQTITTANGSTAAFTLNQFVPDSDSIIVTVGNVVQEPTTAYSAVGTTITFTENVPNGDTIVIRYLGRSVDVPTTYTNINRFKFVATGGQDTFQNNDANGLTLSYTVGNIDVFMNGVRLDESDFTASNGTSVVLGTNASASDEIIIIAYKTVVISNGLDKSSGGTVSGTTVFSGQTTFSGQAYFSGGIFGDVSFDSGVLKIDSGNNRVGVNTNSPATALDVSGSGGNYIATFQNTTSGTPYGVIIKEPSSAGAGYPLLAITNHNGSTTRFRVDSDTGHIGVNRAPTANDTIHINDTQPIIKLEETSSGGSKMTQIGVKSDGTPFLEAPQSGGQFRFIMTGTELGRFHQYGFAVGRGVDMTSSSGPLVVFAPSATHNQNDVTIHIRKQTNVGNDRILHAQQLDSGSFAIRGRIRINSGQNNLEFESSSDRRIKQDIADLTGAIDKIKELKPKTFKFKENPKRGTFAGFIAQELNEVFPTWVTKTDDGTGDNVPIVKNEDDKDEEQPWTIGTDALQFYLVGALKEAIAKIETLEAKVKALEEA